MGSFLDFDLIKQNVSLLRAVELLGLEMAKSGPNQLRGACPACKGSGPRTLVVTDQKGFFCFSAKAGGDQLALVAHVKGIAVKDAAAWLSNDKTIHSTVPPASPKDGDTTKNLAPLDYLETDHAAVIAIGFDVEVAKRIGIGWASKGMMRGTVAVPIRDEHGALLGYIGIESDVRLPPDFMSNVVQLKKPA